MRRNGESWRMYLGSNVNCQRVQLGNNGSRYSKKEYVAPS